MQEFSTLGAAVIVFLLTLLLTLRFGIERKRVPEGSPVRPGLRLAPELLKRRLP